MKNRQETDKSVNTILSTLTDKQVLVTGGLGFLGRWITQMLLDRGAHVTILDHSPPTPNEPPVDIIREDLLQSPKLLSAVSQSDFVVHLAGILGTESTFRNLQTTIENNVTVTARIIEFCLQENKRAIYPMVGNDWKNPYTITRTCAADLGIMANVECNGDFRILKTMNAYGPWQRYGRSCKIIPTFIRQCLLNEPIPIYGDGNQRIDLVHARDVAMSMLLCLAVDDLPLDSYIEIGTGIPHRVIDVAHMIKDMCTSTSPIDRKGKRMGEPVPSETLAKDDTLERITGFTPQVSFQEGLVGTHKWYLNHSEEYLGIPKGAVYSR